MKCCNKKKPPLHPIIPEKQVRPIDQDHELDNLERGVLHSGRQTASSLNQAPLLPLSIASATPNDGSIHSRGASEVSRGDAVLLEQLFLQRFHFLMEEWTEANAAACAGLIQEYPGMQDEESTALRRRYVASAALEQIKDGLCRKVDPQLFRVCKAIEQEFLDRHAPVTPSRESAHLEFTRRLDALTGDGNLNKAVEHAMTSHPNWSRNQAVECCEWTAMFHALKEVRAACLLRGDHDDLRSLEARVFRQMDSGPRTGPAVMFAYGLRVEYEWCHRFRLGCIKLVHDLHTSREQAHPASDGTYDRLAAEGLVRLKRDIVRTLLIEAGEDQALRQAILQHPHCKTALPAA